MFFKNTYINIILAVILNLHILLTISVDQINLQPINFLRKLLYDLHFLAFSYY